MRRIAVTIEERFYQFSILVGHVGAMFDTLHGVSFLSLSNVRVSSESLYDTEGS